MFNTIDIYDHHQSFSTSVRFNDFDNGKYFWRSLDDADVIVGVFSSRIIETDVQYLSNLAADFCYQTGDETENRCVFKACRHDPSEAVHCTNIQALTPPWCSLVDAKAPIAYRCEASLCVCKNVMHAYIVLISWFISLLVINIVFFKFDYFRFNGAKSNECFFSSSSRSKSD